MSKAISDRNPDTSSVRGLAFRGGKALFLRHFLGFAVNFSGGVFLARTLGPEVLGLYFISYTVFIIIRQLIDFGVGVHLIRLPSAPSDGEFRRCFTLQQMIAVLAATAAVFPVAPLAARWYGHTELFTLIASAGLGAYFNSLQSIPLSQLERRMEYGRVGVIEVAEVVAFNLTAVLAALSGHGVAGLAAGNVLRGFVPAILSVSLTGLVPRFAFGREALSGLVRTVSPIIGANLVLWVIMLAPPVLVGSIAGTKELGVAQLAYGLLGNTMFIAAIFQRLSLSSLSRVQDDMERFNRMVQNALKLLFVIYIPFTMGIASLSPVWVPFIYGDKWEGMSGVMLVAAVPFTASALLSVLLSALLSKGHAGLVFRQNLTHAVIYWAVMAASAGYIGALSVSVSHIIAMSAGYIFITGYSRYCGEIAYRPLAAGFAGGVIVMSLAWLSARHGSLVVPVVMWTAFLALYVVFSASARETLVFFIRSLKEL